MWNALYASFVFAFALVGTAHSEPALKALNARSVHVAVAAKGKSAVAVHASASGWRLELRAADSGVAEVFDVTPGSPTRTWTLAMNGGLVTFDRARFVGGHTYRVSLHVDTTTTGVGFVYLYPEAPAKLPKPERPRAQQLRFDANDKGGDDDSAPTVADKGHL
ncbi:MAG TPA: hypothetical protein VIA18_30250 [Polyangia bacterium]|jgi:hypothetical protein|nr:hypothetical protein [Polyangia bacterium]